MKTLNNIHCQIVVFCPISPSEDPKKVIHSISNILPDTEIVESGNSLQATSTNIETLSRIQETIHSRKTQKVYRRTLNRNLEDNLTWFYLNKQAAFVKVIALCENANESPLGPIKITVQSNDIKQIIDWFVDEPINSTQQAL